MGEILQIFMAQRVLNLKGTKTPYVDQMVMEVIIGEKKSTAIETTGDIGNLLYTSLFRSKASRLTFVLSGNYSNWKI